MKQPKYIVVSLISFVVVLLTSCGQNVAPEAAPENSPLQPQAGTTVTKVNGTDAFVDGSSANRTINFSTADFPAGSVVEDVNLQLTFEKTDNEYASCPYTDDYTFNSEIYYSLRSPATTAVTVIPSDTYSGGEYGGVVTVTLDDSAATLVGGGTPVSGTFRPRSALSAVNGQSPFGDWVLTVADTVGYDALCHYNFELSITASVPDATPPSISYVLNPASPPADSNGWYKDDVTLTWTVTENESAASLVKTGCVDQTITADQVATTYSCSATSDGGSADPVEASIKRDATAPSASVLPANLNGATFTLGVDALPTISCSTFDATSDVAREATLTTSGGNTNGVGTFTATCSGAVDNAGNSQTNAASATYNVRYNFGGWQQPVVSLPTRNVVKAGRAVPAKFTLGGDFGLNIFNGSGPVSANISCTSTATDSVEGTLTAGSSSLSYDASTGMYTYVWKSDSAWAGKCRSFKLNLNDGSSHEIAFQFTK